MTQATLPVPSDDARSRWSWAVAAAIVALVLWSARGTQVEPSNLLSAETLRAVAQYIARAFPPDVSSSFLAEVGSGVIETFAISVSGTVVAIVMGACLAVFAARTVVFGSPGYEGNTPFWLRALLTSAYVAARTMLSGLRTVPEIVWALLFVFAVGIGPFPGVLAVGVHTAGVLGKLFSEVFEDVSSRPLEALESCGASRLTVFAYGILPQALPQCIAYSLYRWEVNIRAAAILGFVGAGGLGQQIHVAISLFFEHQLLTLVAAIYVTVTIVDALSTALRRSLR
jgi:phosphonate transport system permease protein